MAVSLPQGAFAEGSRGRKGLRWHSFLSPSLVSPGTNFPRSGGGSVTGSATACSASSYRSVRAQGLSDGRPAGKPWHSASTPPTVPACPSLCRAFLTPGPSSCLAHRSSHGQQAAVVIVTKWHPWFSPSTPCLSWVIPSLQVTQGSSCIWPSSPPHPAACSSGAWLPFHLLSHKMPIVTSGLVSYPHALGFSTKQ